jgi:hypothetical protein
MKFGKAAGVAADCQVEVSSGHLVQFGKIAVEHDSLAADRVNAALDQFHGREYVSAG